MKKKIVFVTFLLFFSTGVLSPAFACRIIDFGNISDANGWIDTDFSISKKELQENYLNFRTRVAERKSVWARVDELIPAERVYHFWKDVEDNSITDTQVPDGKIPDLNPVPEPATLILIGSGLIGLASLKRKKFSK